ncbi:hypothetical protein BSPLISOX_2637 [uncultured Gammaproteobacteria bacterium]|nr:hypothetical protein BSPCLSOX_2843 [uncultured Gammaproteobacteria bacterium]VVH61606.1 hypothetical protein BSPWISOX_2994 [uncultured Gammaproteobacteria bacterium]VVH66507.1 hypothetical protein BSPLISOX_2637 [uncultured Gammaproteobacteria bacterium]VVM18722.1 hypothetical protein BSPWISOXPB_1363 [uncultured Gammaproteobacteria bacterium]
MVSYRVNYLIPINISGLSEQTHNTRIPLTANTSRCRHSVAQLIIEKAKFLNLVIASE